LQDGDRVALPEPAGPVRVHGQIYEDQDGVVWLGANQHGLVRIAPAAQGQVPQAARWAWPDAPSHLPRTFVSAPDGALWVAPFVGLWRVRGKEVTIVEPLGLDDPHVNVRALHVDQAGRLGLGLRFHGVAVTSEPDVALPRFVGYSVRDGLASDVVWHIAEHAGRLYFATARGLDELDPATRRMRRWTARDGLAGDLVNAVCSARQGGLWVATAGGLTHLALRAPRAATPPPVYIAARLDRRQRERRRHQLHRPTAR
jgi:streptogramin lyase